MTWTLIWPTDVREMVLRSPLEAFLGALESFFLPYTPQKAPLGLLGAPKVPVEPPGQANLQVRRLSKRLQKVFWVFLCRSGVRFACAGCVQNVLSGLDMGVLPVHRQ